MTETEKTRIRNLRKDGYLLLPLKNWDLNSNIRFRPYLSYLQRVHVTKTVAIIPNLNFETKFIVSEIFEKVEYVRYPYLYTGLVCDVRNHHVTQNGRKRKTENQIRRIFLYIKSGQLIFAISHFRILRIKNSLEHFRFIITLGAVTFAVGQIL